MSDCNRDIGIDCTGGDDGEPCKSCVEDEADLDNWARGQRFDRYTREEIEDAYSDPTESAKRESLLSRFD